MDIESLPFELQNKIFYYYAEHPLATIFKKEVIVSIEDENTLILEIPVYRNGKKIIGHWMWVSTIEDIKKSQELDEDIKVRNMNHFGYWSRERDFNLRYPNFR